MIIYSPPLPPLWERIIDRPDLFPPEAHTHAYSSLSGIPATFAPSAHSHAISGVTGLQGTLDAKEPSIALADSAAKFWKGDKTWAVLVAADIPNLAGSIITSGTVGAAYLGSGTRNGTKFLRDDGTWQTISASDATKLPLAGGTLTGQLIASHTGSATNDATQDAIQARPSGTTAANYIPYSIRTSAGVLQAHFRANGDFQHDVNGTFTMFDFNGVAFFKKGNSNIIEIGAGATGAKILLDSAFGSGQYLLRLRPHIYHQTGTYDILDIDVDEYYVTTGSRNILHLKASGVTKVRADAQGRLYAADSIILKDSVDGHYYSYKSVSGVWTATDMGTTLPA